MKKNHIYALTAVLIWSTLAGVAKMVLNNIPNMQMLSICSFISFAFLLIVNIANGSIKKLVRYKIKDFAKMAGLGLLGTFLYSALYYFGLSQMSSQEACILNYLWPIMLLVFSCIILRERVTVMKVVAMGCSFVGIVILSLGGGGTDGNTVLGMMAIVIAAACYGLFSVLNKKASFDQNIAMMIIWLTTGVLALILGLVTEQWVPIVGTQWIGILWLGIVVQAIAYLIWAIALSGVENTASIANLAYITPFMSLVVSAVLLGEKIEPRAVIALVFIIGGILLQYIMEHRHTSSIAQKSE